MSKLSLELDSIQAQRLRSIIIESGKSGRLQIETIENDKEMDADEKRKQVVKITKKFAADKAIFKSVVSDIKIYLKQCSEESKAANTTGTQNGSATSSN